MSNPSLAARLREAADWLADDLPEGVVAPQHLEGDVRLDELDAYCIAIMREAAAALAEPSSASRDPEMPVLTEAVREALRQNAKDAYALAETQRERIEAAGLMLLVAWQDRAALSRAEPNPPSPRTTRTPGREPGGYGGSAVKVKGSPLRRAAICRDGKIYWRGIDGDRWVFKGADDAERLRRQFAATPPTDWFYRTAQRLASDLAEAIQQATMKDAA